jgi:hypothetical protein
MEIEKDKLKIEDWLADIEANELRMWAKIADIQTLQGIKNMIGSKGQQHNPISISEEEG